MEMENVSSIVESIPVRGIQTALVGQIAPRVISTASMLMRRHPVLFVSGLLMAAWTWKLYRDQQRRSASSEAPKGPADLVH